MNGIFTVRLRQGSILYETSSIQWIWRKGSSYIPLLKTQDLPFGHVHTHVWWQQKVFHILQNCFTESIDFDHNIQLIIAQITQRWNICRHLQFEMEQFPIEENPWIGHHPWQRHTACIVCHRCRFNALHEQCGQINATQVYTWKLYTNRGLVTCLAVWCESIRIQTTRSCVKSTLLISGENAVAKKASSSRRLRIFRSGLVTM